MPLVELSLAAFPYGWYVPARQDGIDVLSGLEFVTTDRAEVLRHVSLRAFENPNMLEAFEAAAKRV